MDAQHEGRIVLIALALVAFTIALIAVADRLDAAFR